MIEKNRRPALCLAFLLPTATMLVLFAINRIFPFGDRSFLAADLYHQYMPFFSELLHKLRAGDSLGFSFHVGIGSNFYALFVYYLASPMYLLALLIPEAYLIEFISYLVVVKTGLCGLTCCVYFQEHFRDSRMSAMLFSLFYAMSGFLAAYNYNIMWLDCVILLPLIVLGLERLVKEGRCGLYCVTLGLSIITNFYISIMICIFLVLYFLVLLATEKKRLRSIGYFALFSLLAGGMAAALLVPEVCALWQTEFGGMDFPKEADSYFSVLDLLARHFMCVDSSRGLDHWPNLYCGSAVLMLLPMYAFNRRIPIREKFCKLALAGIFLLSFETNFLDFIWHGFNFPDSLPGRQSFLYIFLVLTMCFDAFRHACEVDAQHILHGYFAAVGWFLFCEKFVEQKDFYFGVKTLTLAVASVYAVLLYLYRTRTERKVHRRLMATALAVAVAELGVNMLVAGAGTTSRSGYLECQEDYLALYESTLEREEGLYRLEKFTKKTKNDGTLTGYPTASVFSSTMNSRVMKLYERLGMRHSKVYYDFGGATAFTSALLNVKYMFGESKQYGNSLYAPLYQSGGIFLYECTASLPFGYVAPVGYDLPEDFKDHGLLLQNEMVHDLGIDGVLFEKERKKDRGDDVTFSAGRAGIYYAVLTASGTAKVDYIGGSTETETFGDLKKGSVLYLGYLEKGQTVTLANGDDEDETKKLSADVFRMDEEVLRETLTLLDTGHLENVAWESDRLSGKIAMERAGRLILSVPYEDGWKVTINGKTAPRTTFGDCLMAFDLEPGEYAIEMRYTPVGIGIGMALSAASVMLFAGVTVLQARLRRNHGAEQ